MVRAVRNGPWLACGAGRSNPAGRVPGAA